MSHLLLITCDNTWHIALGWLILVRRKPYPNWESDKTFDLVVCVERH